MASKRLSVRALLFFGGATLTLVPTIVTATLIRLPCSSAARNCSLRN